MAITIKKYVDITSVVGGQGGAQLRDLIGRLNTTNELLPPGTISDFTSASLVGDYFGTTSEEYLRAVKYFSRISKQGFTANLISYSRWVDADTEPKIFGSRFITTLAEFQAITDGSFTLQIGVDVNVISALNFTTALSLADVATILQAGINAEAGTMWTAATVVYNATRGGFDFVGGDAVAATISVSDGMVGTEIKDLIGWGSLAIFSNGALTETISETLQASTDASNNFASFLFMPILAIEEIKEAAEWNKLQNNMFMYTFPVLKVDVQTNYDELNEIGGCGQTINEDVTYTEMDPMIELASTQYGLQNSTSNYMFQQYPGDAVSVTSTAESDQYDALRTNYYGQTQTAGQPLNFYQRGVLFGGAQDAKDMNTYANEIWLKDANSVAIMNLLLGLSKISANTQGIVQITAILQGVIDQAIFNGTISIGKPLNDLQKLFVTQITGDPQAWYQVQSVGYWLDVVIVQNGLDFEALYTLIYSKDDVIRKVKGTQILI